MTNLLFLKLGGSLITDKRQQATARQDVIRRVAREVKRALDESDALSLVVGHGSGSFGHYAAAQFDFAYQKQASFEGFVEIGAAAVRLNRILMDIFLAEDVPAFSVQPSASAICRDGQLHHMDVGLVKRVLARGLVPVVYGDVSLDDQLGWTIISTEQILAYLSRTLQPRRILLAGEVAGVHTGNPALDPDAHLIPEITPANFDEIRTGLTGADGYDVTGGMLSKVEMMVALVKEQPEIEVHLVSGLESEGVYSALLNHPSIVRTVIRA